MLRHAIKQPLGKLNIPFATGDAAGDAAAAPAAVVLAAAPAPLPFPLPLNTSVSFEQNTMEKIKSTYP